MLLRPAVVDEMVATHPATHESGSHGGTTPSNEMNWSVVPPAPRKRSEWWTRGAALIGGVTIALVLARSGVLWSLRTPAPHAAVTAVSTPALRSTGASPLPQEAVLPLAPPVEALPVAAPAAAAAPSVPAAPEPPAPSSSDVQATPPASTRVPASSVKASVKAAHAKTRPARKRGAKAEQGSRTHAAVATNAAPAAAAKEAPAPSSGATVKMADEFDPSAPCSIRVGSHPWAELWIDGKNTNKHTPYSEEIDCGSHELTLVRHDPDVTKTVTINLKPGQSYKRTFALIED